MMNEDEKISEDKKLAKKVLVLNLVMCLVMLLYFVDEFFIISTGIVFIIMPLLNLIMLFDNLKHKNQYSFYTGLIFLFIIPLIGLGCCSYDPS